MTAAPAPLAKAAPAFGLVAVALGIVYVVWGSTYLAIRITVEQAPPLTSMGLRYLTAGVLLAAILSLKGGPRRLRLTGRQVLGTGFLGLMLPMLGNGMVSVGENLGAPSGVTALLIAVTPLMIVVFRLVSGDRPRPATLLGVLLGFAGLGFLILAGQDGAHGDGFPLGATLIVVGAATCWGFGSFMQPRLWLPRDVFVTTVYEMVFGGVIMLTVGRVAGEQFSAADYGPRTWLSLGYLVVFGSVTAFTSYVWLLANAPISLVATYAYVNPVVAVFLGWLVLSEPVTMPVVVGGAVVVLAVAIVIRAERPRRARPAEQPVAITGEPGPPLPAAEQVG